MAASRPQPCWLWAQVRLQPAAAPRGPDPTFPRPQGRSSVKAHREPFQLLRDPEPLPRPQRPKANLTAVNTQATLAWSRWSGVAKVSSPSLTPTAVPGASTSCIVLLNSGHWGLVEHAVKPSGMWPLETETCDYLFKVFSDY